MPPRPERPRLTLRDRDRLRSLNDFKRVYDGKRRVRDDVLIACWLPNDLGRSRLGLSVSKRNGDAVRRNRIKRVLREAFRLERGAIPGDLDLVLIPADPVRCSDLEGARRAFLGLMRKLRRRLEAPKG